MSNLTASDVIQAVTTGCCDERLSELDRAIKMRQRVKGGQFRSGDSVRLNTTVNPKYLIGVTGVVQRVNQKRCIVDFDPGQELGRFAPGIGVAVPFGMLEKV